MNQPDPPGAPAYQSAPPPSATPAFAHWGLRVAAYLLDGLISLPFVAAAGVCVAIAMKDVHATTAVDPNTGLATTTTTGSANGALIAVGVAIYALGLGVSIWNQWIRQGRTGCSLGKQWIGIRLVRERTPMRPPGIGLNIGRCFARILDVIPCYAGLLWPLWDAKRQTFADKICSTVVVKQVKDA